MNNSMTVRYLPTINVFLAVEPRTERRILQLAEDGFYAGNRRGGYDGVTRFLPAVRTEVIEVKVDHVWAVSHSAEEALHLAACRKGV